MSCGKTTYTKKKDAATARNQRQREGSPRLRMYHCRHCNGWHLTHKSA